MKKEVITKEEKKNETSAGMITPETGKETPATINTESATEPPYKIYNNNIMSYVDDFIESEYSGLTEEEIKQNRSFFPLLIQYVYNNYIGDLLHNKLEYRLQGIKPVYKDIKLLDNIFDIYLSLVYKYKFNNRPSITEFSLFTGINRNTITSWNNGIVDDYIINNTDHDKRKYITSDYSSAVQKWVYACEQSLVDGCGEYVKEIFLLKAVHGMRDSNSTIEVNVNHKAIIDADTLPDLIGITSKN